MSGLKISLFGSVQVAHPDWSKEIKLTHTIQGLLAYLLVYRHRTHSRDILANLFWADQSEEKARGSLSTSLWRLRTILETHGISSRNYLLINPSGEVGFNQESDYWLDIALFEAQVSEILATPYPSVKASVITNLENTMQLYQGDLLEGFYDDWALRERERFRSMYLNSLSYLMYYQIHQGVFEKALSFGREILALDPLREEIHREVIRLYLMNGQRALAVRHYEQCCQVLQDELGIQPMAETQKLYARILAEKESFSPPLISEGPSNLNEALQQLQMISHSIEVLRANLTKTIETIEYLIK